MNTLGPNKNLVSIVMPVYNAAAYLKEAIESVLHQNFKNFEFILINDGSTDESEQIIKNFSDERISYHSQTNEGVAASLNKGIKLAKGKYIWRHDADDTSLPDKLEKQVSFLENNPAYALCATQIAFMTQRGKIAYQYRQPKNAYFKGSPYVEVQSEHFNPYSPITHATVLVRRDVILKLNGFRPEFITAEDVDLWLRLIQQYKAVVLNQCDYFVRLNNSSATQRHKTSTKHFKEIALKFAEERKLKGSDPLMRGEDMPAIKYEDPIFNTSPKLNGKELRSDILNFGYKVKVGAKDYAAVFSDIACAFHSGWKIKETYKLILFPLLGEKMVAMGVKIKSILR